MHYLEHIYARKLFADLTFRLNGALNGGFPTGSLWGLASILFIPFLVWVAYALPSKHCIFVCTQVSLSLSATLPGLPSCLGSALTEHSG